MEKSGDLEIVSGFYTFKLCVVSTPSNEVCFQFSCVPTCFQRLSETSCSWGHPVNSSSLSGFQQGFQSKAGFRLWLFPGAGWGSTGLVGARPCHRAGAAPAALQSTAAGTAWLIYCPQWPPASFLQGFKDCAGCWVLQRDFACMTHLAAWLGTSPCKSHCSSPMHLKLSGEKAAVFWQLPC